jgi:trehalose synthase
MEVNVFQRGCDVVVQKSLKEGFGLVVSEALWEGTSVVAGDTAGIRMQIPSAYQQFLADTVEGCAQKLRRFSGMPRPARRSGRQAAAVTSDSVFSCLDWLSTISA